MKKLFLFSLIFAFFVIGLTVGVKTSFGVAQNNPDNKVWCHKIDDGECEDDKRYSCNDGWQEGKCPEETPSPTCTPKPTKTPTPTPTPTSTPHHYECVENACMRVNGAGDNRCNPDINNCNKVSPTPTPTATPTPTSTPSNPGNPGGPGDGRSDGKSDGRSDGKSSSPQPSTGAQVLGAATGPQVLGLSTTSGDNNPMSILFLLPGVVSAVGGFVFLKKNA